MTRLDSFLYSFQSHQAKVIAFDFESTGVNPYAAKILGMSLAFRTATGELESEYFPIAHEVPTNEILGWDFPDSDGWEPSPDNLDLELVLDSMNIVFLDPSILKIAHNAKYDIALGQSHGFEFSEDGIYDTMFASWCLGGQGHGLKSLTEKIFGHKMVDFETLTAYKVVRGKSVLRPLARTQIDKVAQYAAEDAFWTYKLWEHFTGVYRDTGSRSQRLFDLENSLLTLVVEMERNGILVDTGYLKEFSDILRVEQSFLSQELGAMDIYPGSSQNVAKYFEGSKVDLSKYGSEKGKSGVFSVAGGIVQAVADDKGLPAEVRRIAGKINRHREISKLLSTYTSAWLGSVMPDGYIRATFDQRGSVTGRFSSSGPNLQNIPASNFITSTGASYHMRRAIVAPPGMKVVSIDYSQIELRVLAHMSGDQALINAFWANQDVHSATAASLFHIPIEQVTKGQRSIGKTINFAVVYGGGIGVIRRNTGLPWSECEKHFNTFRRLYPGIVQYMDTQTDFATRHGYIETLIGRRVDIGKDGNGYAPRTVAVNSPIQGSAADVIKLAMVSMSGFLRSHREDIRLIMQVHDELVFYISEDRLAEIIPIVANTMETVVRLRVPVHVDVEYGQNWKDLQDFPYSHAEFERNHVLELV